MDRKEPMAGLRFEDSMSDLEDFGMTNTLEVSKMPVEVLTSMGTLGRDGAWHVHEYCQDKILGPLGKPGCHNTTVRGWTWLESSWG